MKKELIKQLQELVAKNKVDSFFPGEWDSIIKGHGIEFVELREYSPGDPYTNIHWKKTAQDPEGKIYVKQHHAESFASVMILCDVSKSMCFSEKESIQTILAASLAYSALRRNNSCGMIMFSDKVETYLHPGHGDIQMQYIIETLTNSEAKDCKCTKITKALEKLIDSVSRSLTFIISDFNTDNTYFNFLQSLDKNNHDVVALMVAAQSEIELPEKGCLVELTDLEKGGTFLLDAHKYSNLYLEEMIKEKQRIKSDFESIGIDSEIITTKDSLVKKINHLLIKRKEKTR